MSRELKEGATVGTILGAIIGLLIFALLKAKGWL
jgi:hypothetical protein